MQQQNYSLLIFDNQNCCQKIQKMKGQQWHQALPASASHYGEDSMQNEKSHDDKVFPHSPGATQKTKEKFGMNLWCKQWNFLLLVFYCAVWELHVSAWVVWDIFRLPFSLLQTLQAIKSNRSFCIFIDFIFSHFKFPLHFSECNNTSGKSHRILRMRIVPTR